MFNTEKLENAIKELNNKIDKQNKELENINKSINYFHETFIKSLNNKK